MTIKLNTFDKLLMTMLKLKLKNKNELISDEKGMLPLYNKPLDFTKGKNIDAIINYINS